MVVEEDSLLLLQLQHLVLLVDGAGLTVNTTVDGNGNITAAAVNAGGSDYLITDTVTITNANAGKVLALNLATLSGGTGYTTAVTGVSATGGTGSSLTVTYYSIFWCYY